ncbi:antitoxin MazE-like protein [Mycobacterium sp.]|uniref:antitoxin MazE-like protein n=1 Tax=Mycobacterium sp. TaxID=1785 RepID=UPI0025D8FD9A|nr:antitoxin MazE-like protein [Mycobacterium sp.]
MRNRVAEYRHRMKARGYKEVRYWVPDVTSAEFVERLRAESMALNASDRRDATADFLDDIQADTIDAR